MTICFSSQHYTVPKMHYKLTYFTLIDQQTSGYLPSNAGVRRIERFPKIQKGGKERQMAQSETASGRRKLISVDRLRKVDFLQGLAEVELRSIAHFFKEENVGAGVSLCEEGARAERLYVLEQGRISISSKNSRRYDIYTPGKTVGSSFWVPPFLYTASAVTTAPSKLLVIKSRDFYDFIHNDSKMEMKVLSNMTQVIASRLVGA